MVTKRDVPPIEAYGDPFKTLESCGGVYRCPNDLSGKRIGPLVACGGTYDRNGQRLAYVGEIYYYFAMAMQYPYIVDHWARRLSDTIIEKGIRDEDVYLGLPLQGARLAQALARNSKYTRAVQIERSGGEFFPLQVKSYQVCRGDRAIIVEDMGNSFRTAEEVICQVETLGAKVIAIVCVCTRSFKERFHLASGKEIPIITLAQKSLAQFYQHDPFVVGADIEFNPEANWEKLMEFMKKTK